MPLDILQIRLLSEISFQQFASGSVLKPPDGLLLDLPNPFTGEVKFGANFIEGQPMVHADAKIEIDNIPFFLGKGSKRTLNLPGQ